MENILTGRYWGSWYGAHNMINHVVRAANPLLLHLYTKKTFLIMGAGLLASLISDRIMAPFALLAILTMDHSKNKRQTFWACVIWTILCIAFYLFETLYRYPLLMAGKISM